MKTTLTPKIFDAIREKVAANAAEIVSAADASRQPVHVLYGGAHLFKFDTPAKLARIAEAAFNEPGRSKKRPGFYFACRIRTP